MPVPMPPHLDMSHAPASLRYFYIAVLIAWAAIVFYGAWDILRRRR
jgi:hypothetical protein